MSVQPQDAASDSGGTANDRQPPERALAGAWLSLVHEAQPHVGGITPN